MLNSDLIATLGKYVIALAVLIGSFVVISQDTANASAWGVVGIVVGWIVRDSAGTSATTNAVKTIAAVTPPVGPASTDSTP